jgi:hypothetical protein
MNRLPLAALVLVSLAFTNMACSRGPAPSGTEKPSQNVTAATNSLDPKILITDEKIGQYIVYQKEMNSVSDIMIGVAGQALNKSDGSQKSLEKALSEDERTKRIADTQASALSKSGLTQMQANEIAQIVSSFTPGATMGDAEMKQQAHQEFLTKYGPEVLTVLERRLPELSKLQDEMLQATLGKKK